MSLQARHPLVDPPQHSMALMCWRRSLCCSWMSMHGFQEDRCILHSLARWRALTVDTHHHYYHGIASLGTCCLQEYALHASGYPPPCYWHAGQQKLASYLCRWCDGCSRCRVCVPVLWLSTYSHMDYEEDTSGCHAHHESIHVGSISRSSGWMCCFSSIHNSAMRTSCT